MSLNEVWYRLIIESVFFVWFLSGGWLWFSMRAFVGCSLPTKRASYMGRMRSRGQKEWDYNRCDRPPTGQTKLLEIVAIGRVRRVQASTGPSAHKMPLDSHCQLLSLRGDKNHQRRFGRNFRSGRKSSHRPLGLPATHTCRCFWRCLNSEGVQALHLSWTIFFKVGKTSHLSCFFTLETIKTLSPRKPHTLNKGTLSQTLRP